MSHDDAVSQSSPDHLQRKLQNRHLQLIAIGGAIGTGLFMGSGKTISLAGPSIIFIYMIIGLMVFFVMRALGELLLSNLQYKSFVDMAYDLLGPWAGFFTGWTYWLCWVSICIADLTAIVNYLTFWLPEGTQFTPLGGAAISAGCVLFLMGLNLLTVKLFGEVEFWFALIKIVAIVALICAGLYMVLTAFTSPSGSVASLTNLWTDGGMFPNGLKGFLAGFQIAIFAFVGIELVGTTAAETKDPEKNLPKAINSIPVRVILFYVLSLVVVMSVTPWRSVVPDKSPFVELFLLAGIPVAAIVMNLVVLSSVMSSMNSGIFSTSRMLFGLAKDKQAPSFFERLSSVAVPANGLIFSCVLIMSGALLQYFVPNTITAFTLVTTLSTILFICVWIIVLLSYIKYRKTRPQLHATSKFKMPGGVAMCYVVIAFFIFTVFILTLEPDTRQSLIVSPIWLVILALSYLMMKRKPV
ncbi:D-serine/D-alanine/glycine transporter [Alkanindiges illinoisensis]|uniref:D-serine/D-alanine/glycine transporter n=2 Tax=Alkanindiges illinoisensis TaxID=197183 RepID=A0A4Y7XF22_9GAMM|nr:D-serine/D-alanine/glycine transporter [Alkanindiges illinoisensis]TEU30216.1 D-serine/D-alanine/glycine transporter [Alkanindiges illinoisensis]